MLYREQIRRFLILRLSSYCAESQSKLWALDKCLCTFWTGESGQSRRYCWFQSLFSSMTRGQECAFWAGSAGTMAVRQPKESSSLNPFVYVVWQRV
jgi:hypothetical protein